MIEEMIPDLIIISIALQHLNINTIFNYFFHLEPLIRLLDLNVFHLFVGPVSPRLVPWFKPSLVSVYTWFRMGSEFD